LLDQLELQLADLEENAAQADTAAEMVAADRIAVASFERRKPARRPLPEHLPRERIVYPVPASCPCCGDNRLRKIGEDVTEMLELIPRQWKVIQHVREKFVCRACEAITQPPAPSHPIARGRAGSKLLAHILFAKYGLHLPLNRQSEVYQREGIDLDVSTLADWVGASAATLSSLPSVSMPTTPRCRSWPRARRGPAGSGPMCAMTAPLPGQIRRQPCSSIRPIVVVSIRSSIWRAMSD
jgi:transposase